jgi:hypothetical protein
VVVQIAASPKTGAFPGRNAPVSFCAPGRPQTALPVAREQRRQRHIQRGQ